MAKTSAHVLSHPTVWLKCLELGLSVACSMLVVHAIMVTYNAKKTATIYATLMGFVMVNTVTLMSCLLKTPLHKTPLQMLLAAVSLCGAIMFIAAGALILEYYIHSLLPIIKKLKSEESKTAMSGLDGLKTGVGIIISGFGGVLNSISPSVLGKLWNDAADAPTVDQGFTDAFKPERILASGVLAIVNALIYLVDVLLTLTLKDETSLVTSPPRSLHSSQVSCSTVMAGGGCGWREKNLY